MRQVSEMQKKLDCPIENFVYHKKGVQKGKVYFYNIYTIRLLGFRNESGERGLGLSYHYNIQIAFLIQEI